MDLLNIFQHSIDFDTYKQILREVFKADELLDNSHIEKLPTVSDDDKGYYVGNKRTSDRYNIGFFYYEIGRSNVARKKVGLRNLVHKFINSRDGQFDAALVAFKDANHWRLSFICDIQEEATAPKRFTFVFGDADNLYKTPIDRFGKLQQKGVTKTTIQDAFSVEALNDQFFKDYKAHYEKFCDFLYEHANDAEYFGEEFAHWNSDEKTQKYLRDYVKNLLGRIVFLHYLQKKGWMGVPSDSVEWKGGSQNFMYELFKNSTQTQKENFLDEVLESLFFNCLNTDRSADNDIYDTKVATIGKVRVPYLNGELFEEGFLDKPKSKFSIELFENLFNLFNSYNFTIDENDPSDAEIGVDPEMLGKIFENLLEDNKDKGVYYTPKEIVSYMCKESLIAYLQSKIGKAHHDSIRTLVNTHLKDKHLEEDQNVCERLNKALRNVKVCDPAIGSGAFPMGLLNEIFACRCQLETSDKPKDELKGEIIQNNIYGVDIERGAVDIARLRFWLALIVDAEKPIPLPNLDYKIMQGNSLLESYKGQDLTKFMENAFAQPYAIQLNKDLKKYYKETDNKEKSRLRNSIDFTISQCIFQCGIQDQIELPNAEFFLWHTYFKDVFDEGGFDIVIGNPPYIDSETMVKIMPEARNAYASKFKTTKGNWDIYIPFYELGLEMLNATGKLAFITPNKWVSIGYGKKLRELYFDYFSQVCDCSSIKVFEAGNEPLICFFDKAKSASIRVWKAYSDGFVQVDNVPKTRVSKDSLGMLLSRHMDLLLKICKAECSVADFSKAENPFSTSEAYELCPYINEISATSQPYYILINTGTIDPFITLWGTKTTSYLKSKYIKPIVTRTDFATAFPRRVRQTAPKIVITGMRYFEAYYDFNGNCIAGKSTIIIPQNNCVEEDMIYLLALFNTKLIQFYINQSYSVLGINGGINFSADMVDALPIPLANADTKEKIVEFTNKIILLKKSDLFANTTAEEHEIGRLVYELYGLTNGEVKIIDPNEITVGRDNDLFKA